jgi:electron transfer flavoprotein alpha subunit
MKYIVLVKQVPDIKNIPKEAWDWEKGTLKRALLENVCNDLDKQAVAFTLKLAEKQPGTSVALTMGPPFADEVLKYAMSLGIDQGVLLTDRKLGGADTAATAYPLAQAIRRIEKEIFNGDKNYIIVSGMQSVDGDTAQVPPQIAEEMGIAHIAYATSFSWNGKLQVSRITRRGSETVAPRAYPCLITVTQWTEPLFASFARTRWVAGQKIAVWDADSVQADKASIGLAGSRTNVFKIFSPKDAIQRNTAFETDMNKLVALIKESFITKGGATQDVEKPKYKLPEGKKSEYKGDVWIYAEHEGGELHPASFELLGKAKELAEPLGEKVGAVLVGKGVGNLAKELISYGADKVYLMDNDLLGQFLPMAYAKAISAAIEKFSPQMMIISATPLGRELGPRVAYASRSGLTADCTALDIIDFKRGDKERIGILVQTRPALGGNIMASIITQNARVQMSTARPGVMKALKPDASRNGEVIEFKQEIKPSDLGYDIVNAEVRQLTSEIKDAAILVCGGGGCKTKDNYDRLVHPLVEAFGKLLNEEAMPAATRVAVEAGFNDRSHQVGQTGQTVKPRLYVAIGVSGAVQHVTGMQGSDVILAINKDPNARIFKTADFGIVGNMEEVVPELLKALNSTGGKA